MSFIRRAVIDVGTNSVKLLVADVSGSDVRPVCEQSKQTRLGSGFYETRRLQPGPIAKTAEAVATFAGVAREKNSVTVRCIATSAARDAVNAGELVSAIESASGLEVEIISGGQEAEWAFRGVTTDPKLAACPVLLLDVGGGSTEFILGHGEHKHFVESFPLGSVRLMEKMSRSDPPRPEELAACRKWLKNFLSKEVQPKLKPELRRETKVHGGGHVKLVGTGGTTSILARMELRLEDFNRDRLEAVHLSLDQLRRRVEHLWSLPLTARREVSGLPSNRADVILTGSAIYEAVMEEFGFTELRVSTRGLRFAAVMSE